MIARNWIKSLPIKPTIVGIQELKTSSFLTIVSLDTILLDYPQIMSLLDKAKRLGIAPPPFGHP